MRNTKHRLASLALDDIFGKANVNDLFGLDEDGDGDAEASPLKRKVRSAFLFEDDVCL